SQRSIEPARVVEGIAELLEQNPDITNAAVYIISDFQRHDWIGHEIGSDADEADADDSSVVDPLAAWADDDRGLHLVLINVGDDDAANLAVTELSIAGGQIVAGTTGTVRALVENNSERSVENLELQVTVGNMPQPSKTLRALAAWQGASVDLKAGFLTGGSEAVRVEIPPDALPADNTRYIVVDVANAIRVLIVNGEPSADDFDDEVSLLATALRPEGELFSGNEVVIVDEAELEDVKLSDFHVVVLANVYRLSGPEIDA
ncbi:unnamed protein product, partial [marine sediment metagenome]